MRLSTLSYCADFLIGLGLVACLTVAMTFEPWRKDFAWAGLVILGVLIWTLAEYLIHRWIYHHVPYFARLHAAHHAEPQGSIGAPPLIGIAIILGLFYLPFVATNPVVADGLTVGVLLGYCAYQLLHHAVHHWSPAPTSWLYHARHHHALHHYHSEEVNFGITTALWDRLFGTDVKSAQRRAA